AVEKYSLVQYSPKLISKMKRRQTMERVILTSSVISITTSERACRNRHGASNQDPQFKAVLNIS
ncbi:5984_t:CDS:2, partial [Funneliformis caledonium]